MANSYLIQIYDPDIEPMVKQLASEDMRSIGNEVAWLVRKEYTARYSEIANQVSHQRIYSSNLDE